MTRIFRFTCSPRLRAITLIPTFRLTSFLGTLSLSDIGRMNVVFGATMGIHHGAIRPVDLSGP
jgi:hypothetical protein